MFEITFSFRVIVSFSAHADYLETSEFIDILRPAHVVGLVRFCQMNIVDPQFVWWLVDLCAWRKKGDEWSQDETDPEI